MKSDKSNIEWCLSFDGWSSFMASHPGIVCAPIETKFANFLVGKLVKLAKKQECEECIDYIIKNQHNPNELQIAIFDFLMREYVWYMGEAYYKNSKDLKQGFRGIRLLFDNFNNKKRLDEYLKELNKFICIIITNLLDPYGIISENDYGELSILFLKDNHVRFKNLKAPVGHVYEGERFINIVSKKDRKETTAYYKSHYKGYSFLSKGFQGDYPDCFYRFATSTDLTNDDETSEEN